MPTVNINTNEFVIDVVVGTKLTELDDIIPFGCRAGACGSCAIKVTKGISNLSPISFDEREFLQMLELDTDFHRLACQCKVVGDVSIQFES